MADTLNFSNFARSKLAADISADSVQLTIEDDSMFPDGLCTAVVWSANKATPLDDPYSEVMLITKNQDVFDAVRAGEGTASKDWQAGSFIANAVTAETMEHLWDAAAVSASVSEIPDNIYTMQRGDTSAFFVFDENEQYKTVTLPASILCTGLTYKIINRGSTAEHVIRLFPDTGDTFAHTDNIYMSVPSGAEAVLNCLDGVWTVTDYRNCRMNGIKKVDANAPYVSFGDGLVFADASAGGFDISLPTDEGIAGRTLTIVKYDAEEEYVYIGAFSDYPGALLLYGQFESATFITEADGTVRMLSKTAPDSLRAVTIYASVTLRGYERTVLANAGASDITVTLPHADIFKGRQLTVKKIDSGAGRVRVKPSSGTVDGVIDHYITLQWEYASFASNGSYWYRVG